MSDLSKDQILSDYRIGWLSRHASLIGRKEVLSGKAKFGIFGDGKEVAQLAMARAFQKGDWRSGYYRDQTFMFAVGATNVDEFFAQLFANPDLKADPASGGRQMNSHFSTRYIDAEGNWLDQTATPNSSADASPTACQMSRLLGLGYASKLYRQNKALSEYKSFSVNGNEVAFGTIGNASTAEGIFWESFNAAGVLQVPICFSVWDDGYGISVPNKYQMTKESISEITAGFAPTDDKPGIDIITVKGWDYPTLVSTYAAAVDATRKTHQPCLVHVIELTQPQGHSTSGSHERYKTAERMKFEESHDCLTRMREWIIAEGIADATQLDSLEAETQAQAEEAKRKAWEDYNSPINTGRDEVVEIFSAIAAELDDSTIVEQAAAELRKNPTNLRRINMAAARRMLLSLADEDCDKTKLLQWIDSNQAQCEEYFDKYLFSEGEKSALNVQSCPVNFGESPENCQGHDVIREYFDHLFGRDPRVFAIGEDVGHLGGVNQGFKDLQKKYGEIRITDTGIRENSILGQGIGAAMRGLRPIVDIQYLDYLLYCFQTLSDDLATLHYRSAGGQLAPCIVRTKGHRLEGIWHTGSPMGMIINGIRGMHVCVPRNMVQAVGMYNTLMKSDDPALVIEVLNGYRVREQMPKNFEQFTVELGVPEVLIEGSDLTIVTYGACVQIAREAAKALEQIGIGVELIDVQTLLPFDRYHVIGGSVEKTNAVLFFDEDVPGGAAAYMMQQVLDHQDAYDCLDAKPEVLSAKPHRAAYGSDGDYWSKPSAEDVVEKVYGMMRGRFPQRFEAIR